MLLFWVGASTENFYKTSKNTNIVNVKNANSFFNIPRRFLDNEEDNKRSASLEGHDCLHTSKPRFCNEQRKIFHGTKHSNGILEILHRFGLHSVTIFLPEKEKRR